MQTLNYPYQVPIESFGTDGFGFKGMVSKGHMLALPSKMIAWDGVDYEMLFAEPIDFLIIGSGNKIIPIAPALKSRFREAGISSDVMMSVQAKATYNIMLSENRRVAGAFIFE
jgi:uncharacterized protein